MKRAITIVYFAWVKERLGLSEEEFELTDGGCLVSDVIASLRNRDAAYKETFQDLTKLRFALDHDFVQLSARIGGAKELAVFPPVTGG